MTLASILGWFIFAGALMVVGAKGGFLLLLSRGIDNTRAAIRCAGLSCEAARGEWVRNWESCQGWARRER
jgi:hypothetical protein